MPSGQTKAFKGDTWVTVGQVSNVKHQMEVYGKAGTNRRLG
jgi:ribosomal protein L2